MKFCSACWQTWDDDALERCPRDGAALRAADPAEDRLDALVGRRVDGRFLVTAALGRGAMGAVFQATQLSMRREVALKVIEADLSGPVVRRFEREARATAQLTHVHTVSTIDFGHDADNGLLYLALELLTGETLSERLQREGPQPWKAALRIAARVAASLAEAHVLGIVHRDIKPANLYLARMGDDRDFVKVLDFGIAQLRSEEAVTQLTTPGTVLGSARFMAPEQITGHAVDGRADLYSLGVVLFNALTGRAPFDAATGAAIFEQHCTADVPDLDATLAVPDGVADLVHLLLEKDPRDRVQDARELEARCRALLA